MIRLNLGNAGVAFDGFINSADLFGAGSENLNEKQLMPSPEVLTTPWKIEDNSVSEAKLIYVLEQPDVDMTSIMSELYRVCRDGALIEIRARTKAYLKKHTGSDELYVDKTILNMFDRTFRAAVRSGITSEKVLKLDCDFKIMSVNTTFSAEFLEKIRNNTFSSDKEIMEEVQNSDYAVEYQTFYLYVCKNTRNNYALARLPGRLPYILRISADQHSDAIQELVKTGIYNPKDSALLLHLLNKTAIEVENTGRNMFVCCVGADFGWYPLLLAKNIPGTRVDAFESEPESFSALQDNIALNSLEDVVCINNLAVGAAEGKLTLTVSDVNDDEADDAFGLCIVSKKQIELDMVSLSDVYLAEKNARPDVLMVSVNGREQSVFDGAEKLFDDGWRPFIQCKFAPGLLSLHGKCTFYRDLIERYGYKAFVIEKQTEEEGGRASLVVADVKNLNELYELMVKSPDYNRSMVSMVFMQE